MCRTGITSTAPADCGAPSDASRADSAPRRARDSLRGDELEGTARYLARWLSPGVQLLCGRSWHNLWVMPSTGGDAFPIAYGDWDQTYPRWSPDGTRIAFISNSNGGTEICIERIPGGVVQSLPSASAAILTPDGAAAAGAQGYERESGVRAHECHRRRRPLLCAARCLDSRRRWFRPAPAARSRHTTFMLTAGVDRRPSRGLSGGDPAWHSSAGSISGR